MELDIDEQVTECISQKRIYKKEFSDLTIEFEPALAPVFQHGFERWRDWCP